MPHMNDFSKGNPYNFRRSEDEEWFLIHDSAVTNTNPNSIVEVTIDTTPICKNMTDREFRNIVLSLRDDAVSVIRQRLQELSSWSPSARSRVRTWFGSDDDATRQTLINGLNALAPIMSELKATNFCSTGFLHGSSDRLCSKPKEHHRRSSSRLSS
ncbi:hypothetical protein PSP6_210060 [Paraburkholderia tropica]|nr:hypothetical protein PSP6_210060 [Paraburkholderia tropica]